MLDCYSVSGQSFKSFICVYRDRGELFSPDQGDESPWATPSTPATPPTPTEAEGDGLSYNQRSLQRWEKDEELGELSTISPVLYANINFPHLKQDYPGDNFEMGFLQHCLYAPRTRDLGRVS